MHSSCGEKFIEEVTSRVLFHSILHLGEGLRQEPMNAQAEHLLTEESTPLSISFSGSGFLSTYQLGVSQCLLENTTWITQRTSKVYGSSAGALVAAAVVCGASMGGVRDDVIEFAKLVREHSFGPLHPAVNVFKWMENTIRRRLPLESHKLASGRLCISMTRVPDGKNVIVSEFQTHEDVVKALLCSCFIPMYCGVIPPSYKGVHYVDGGLTNIQPTQTAGQTITISPFSGDMDICPQDDTSPLCDFVVNGHCFKPTLSNLFRAGTALYPRDWKVLSEAYVNGYQDAVEYLQHHALEVRTEYESIAEASRVRHGISVLKVELSTSPSQPRTSSIDSDDRHVCALQFTLK
ncbi:patatin-like phospholipase domain-containing protein 2 [Alosa pseudoharengus]|uniref:patatin-like phospholipase domain-containing protein 2 n=1 Tax=Alosa pseudoharengus TaxID=34774 RepID=UPI003F8CDAAA